MNWIERGTIAARKSPELAQYFNDALRGHGTGFIWKIQELILPCDCLACALRVRDLFTRMNLGDDTGRPKIIYCALSLTPSVGQASLKR